MPSLSLLNLNRAHYETHQYQWVISNGLSRAKASEFSIVPIIHYSTLTKEDTFEDVTSKTMEIEIDAIDCHIKAETDESHVNEIVKKVKNKKKHKQNVDAQTVPKIDKEERKCYIGSADESNEVNNDIDYDDNDDFFNVSCKLHNKADGSKLNEEYAQMVPISVKEARAAIEVKKLYMSGFHKCNGCGRAFKTMENLKVHSRMHDKVSGV